MAAENISKKNESGKLHKIESVIKQGNYFEFTGAESEKGPQPKDLVLVLSVDTEVDKVNYTFEGSTWYSPMEEFEREFIFVPNGKERRNKERDQIFDEIIGVTGEIHAINDEIETAARTFTVTSLPNISGNETKLLNGISDDAEADVSIEVEVEDSSPNSESDLPSTLNSDNSSDNSNETQHLTTGAGTALERPPLMPTEKGREIIKLANEWGSRAAGLNGLLTDKKANLDKLKHKFKMLQAEQALFLEALLPDGRFSKARLKYAAG